MNKELIYSVEDDDNIRDLIKYTVEEAGYTIECFSNGNDMLEALKKPCDVELTSDSKYLVDAFNQKWIDGWIKKGWVGANKQPVKNQDLWKRLLEAKKEHNVKFIWIKGHNGHEYNELCDKMAVQSSNSDNLLDDEGFTP